ncbi:hypothetical protein D1872_294780 [compost metagenome]
MAGVASLIGIGVPVTRIHRSVAGTVASSHVTLSGIEIIHRRLLGFDHDLSNIGRIALDIVDRIIGFYVVFVAAACRYPDILRTGSRRFHIERKIGLRGFAAVNPVDRALGADTGPV